MNMVLCFEILYFTEVKEQIQIAQNIWTLAALPGASNPPVTLNWTCHGIYNGKLNVTAGSIREYIFAQ